MYREATAVALIGIVMLLPGRFSAAHGSPDRFGGGAGGGAGAAVLLLEASGVSVERFVGVELALSVTGDGSIAGGCTTGETL